MMAKKRSPKKRETVFTKFLDNDGFNNLRISLDRLLMRPSWWIASKKTLSSIKPLPRTQRARGVEDYLSLSDYYLNFVRRFKCPSDPRFLFLSFDVRSSSFAFLIERNQRNACMSMQQHAKCKLHAA